MHKKKHNTQKSHWFKIRVLKIHHSHEECALKQPRPVLTLYQISDSVDVVVVTCS